MDLDFNDLPVLWRMKLNSKEDFYHVESTLITQTFFYDRKTYIIYIFDSLKTRSQWKKVSSPWQVPWPPRRRLQATSRPQALRVPRLLLRSWFPHLGTVPELSSSKEFYICTEVFSRTRMTDKLHSTISTASVHFQQTLWIVLQKLL